MVDWFRSYDSEYNSFGFKARWDSMDVTQGIRPGVEILKQRGERKMNEHHLGIRH